MALQFTTSYLEDSLSLLRYYKVQAEQAMEQVSEEKLFLPLDLESNSIAILVKHMAGNMRSRWTNFLTSDGEKPDRNRDGEFEEPPVDREQLLILWNQGWDCVFQTLESLQEVDLTRTVFIRGEAHSVMQAINRQMAHYASHVGQIILLAKHFAYPQWQSLTIPRKQSAQFNQAVAEKKSSQR